jgi:hypothetical protein
VIVELKTRAGVNDTPSAMIIGQTADSIVVAVTIPRAELARHRRFLEMLLHAATTPAVEDAE